MTIQTPTEISLEQQLPEPPQYRLDGLPPRLPSAVEPPEIVYDQDPDPAAVERQREFAASNISADAPGGGGTEVPPPAEPNQAERIADRKLQRAARAVVRRA